MSQVVTAVFENGAFTPSEEITLPEHAQVRLTVELLSTESQNQDALKALEDLWRNSKIHSPEERLTRDQLHERR